MSWLDIETATMSEDAPPVLVDNGVRVGEAHIREDWSHYDENTFEPVLRWAWTHHSTCSCCHSFMEPQPHSWQPLPEPRNSPCKPSPDANI